MLHCPEEAAVSLKLNEIKGFTLSVSANTGQQST